MNEDFKSIKVKPILGSLPEMGATDWWTQEQWDEHDAYVEKLKKEGKYLTEGEEITINFKKKHLEMFCDNRPPEERFKNFGLLMPQGNESKDDQKIIIEYSPKNKNP